MSNSHSFGDKKVNRRRLLLGIICIISAVLVVIAALLVIHFWENRQGNLPVPTITQDTVTYNGREYVKKKNTETLLVMGLDKYEGQQNSDSYNNDQQADFLMLFVIDNKNKEYSAIHINRDTMTDISVLGLAGEKVGTVNAQLALAHTYGDGEETSCRNTVQSVENILEGVSIDRYISVTMDAVPEFNDMVGGVEVQVLDDFSGVDDTLVMGETVLLKGEHALKYVRTRFGLDDSTNKRRMERQRQYLEALQEKTKAALDTDAEFAVKAIDTIDKYMVSNCTVTDLQKKFEKLSDYALTEIYDIDGEYVTGEEHIEFYPDEASVKEVVMNVFYVPAE